jgi:hypothetical protein
MQCDSGPSFPAAPLIQDDGLLRREIPPRQAKTGLAGGPGFARRGFPGARRVCTGANPTTDPTDDTDLHGSDKAGEKNHTAGRRGYRCFSGTGLWNKGVACQEGQKCNGFWVRFCQDGRIPMITSY